VAAGGLPATTAGAPGPAVQEEEEEEEEREDGGIRTERRKKMDGMRVGRGPRSLACMRRVLLKRYCYISRARPAA
jgi:hypothetical protein